MLCPNIALLDALQKIQRPEAEEMAAAKLPLLASRPCSSNCKDRKGSSTFKKALLVIPVCGYTACMLCCSVVSDSATPWTVAHQAPPSMGFSRQKYWSGCCCLLHCVKVKSESEVAQSHPNLCDPMDCSLPGSSIHGIF